MEETDLTFYNAMKNQMDFNRRTLLIASRVKTTISINGISIFNFNCS